MALSKELVTIFDRLGWDAPSIGVFMWLHHRLRPGETLRTSLAVIEGEVKLGRIKLHKILSRFKKNNFFHIQVFARKGVELRLIDSQYVETNAQNLKINLQCVENNVQTIGCVDINAVFPDLTNFTVSGICVFSPISFESSSSAAINSPSSEASDKPLSNELTPFDVTKEVIRNSGKPVSAENGISGKKPEKKPARKKKQQPQESDFTPEELELATAWLEFAKREMVWRTPPASWNVVQFALDLRKVAKHTSLNFDGLKRILTFVDGNQFWSRNALSPRGLLEKSAKNDLRKIDNILSQLKPQSFRAEQALARLTPEQEKQLLDDPWGMQ